LWGERGCWWLAASAPARRPHPLQRRHVGGRGGRQRPRWGRRTPPQPRRSGGRRERVWRRPAARAHPVRGGRPIRDAVTRGVWRRGRRAASAPPPTRRRGAPRNGVAAAAAGATAPRAGAWSGRSRRRPRGYGGDRRGGGDQPPRARAVSPRPVGASAAAAGGLPSEAGAGGGGVAGGRRRRCRRRAGGWRRAAGGAAGRGRRGGVPPVRLPRPPALPMAMGQRRAPVVAGATLVRPPPLRPRGRPSPSSTRGLISVRVGDWGRGPGLGEAWPVRASRAVKCGAFCVCGVWCWYEGGETMVAPCLLCVWMDRVHCRER